MFSVANHVISAASITIFAASVTGGQRMADNAQADDLSLPVGSGGDWNAQVVTGRIHDADSALMGCKG